MRLAIRLQLGREAWLPFNHQDQLTGLVYRLLNVSDADYARFLHDQGYRAEEGGKRFKLFCFSNLRIPKGQRQVVGDRLRLRPGPIDWYLASPVEDFLVHSATGLLTAGAVLHVGALPLTITAVEALPQPVFAPRTRFTCLTPIVASVARPAEEGGGTYYLRPADAEKISLAICRNLARKWELVYGETTEEELRLEWDADYLRRDAHGGTKKISYRDIDVVGALAPFTLEGSTALMQLAWECGLGEKNSIGFGMIALSSSGD